MPVIALTLKFSELLASTCQTSYLKLSRVPIFGKIKAFSLADDCFKWETRQFLGDNRERQFWSTELNIAPDSEVSSICISGSRCIATSFGSSARIFLQDLNVVGRTSLLTLNGVHDIWCADLRDQSLVLGSKGQAIYIANIDATPPISLPTQSDVFSVAQQQDLVYTGCRNGSIARFDMRVGRSRAQILFPEQFANRAKSSVFHLKIVQHSQMVVSPAFDLRFSRQSTPLITYPHHVNSLTGRLGIAVDPSERFLFAAGDDSRLRAWCIQTGELLPGTLPSHPTLTQSPAVEAEPDMSNPFHAVFSDPVETMQVTDDGGLSLWVACGEQLYQYRLGMRA
ncbi:hypothetical protein BD779DRAFT_1668891 [Infundibulicybe gibba]|nr:hypothetical protein BD779DRAFT_1668891 [Infundibulicybe gibba]